MRAAHALPRRAARGAAVLSMRAGRAQLGNPCRPSHAFTRGPHNTLCLQRDDGLLQQPAGLPASSLSSAATAQQMQPPPAQIIRMHGTDAHVCLAPSASPSSRSTLACAHHCEWHSRQIGWRAQTSADGSHNRARESPELHTPCGSVRLLHWLTPVQASTLRHQAGSGLHSERCSALCAAVRGTSIIARRPLPTDDNT